MNLNTPIVFSLPDPPILEGKLSPDGPLSLTKAERLFEGKLEGAESIVVDNGRLRIIWWHYLTNDGQSYWRTWVSIREEFVYN